MSNDYEIEKAVRQAWAPFNRSTDLLNVNANVANGIVTIDGSTSADIEQELIKLAQAVPGVVSVKSHLKINQGA